MSRRKRGLTEEAATASIDQACRMLRLSTIHQQFKEMFDGVGRDQMVYRGFLAELLMAECDDRARRRSERRPRAAAFPRDKCCGPLTSTRAPASTPRPSTPSPPASG